MKDEKFLSGLVTGAVGSLAVFAIAIFVVVLVLGKGNNSIRVTEKSETSKTIEESEEEIFDKITLLSDIITEYSLYEVDDSEIIEGIYQGMFDSMGDKYADYYTAEEFAVFNEDTSGEYCGIGAYIAQDMDNGVVYISEPMEGSPAKEAGLRADDIIYKVDGNETTDKDSETVASWIKGEEGTKVQLTIIREGEADYLTFDITRKKIEVPTVEYEMIEGNIGYISIVSFDEVTTTQFENAVNDLKAQEAKGFIIDLRSNPGGILTVVVDMLDMFLDPNQMIVYTEDKDGNTIEKYTSKTSKVIDIPLVVMINGYSASASEIFAGVIQDYELGTLVGTTTYGKGIVQSVQGIGDGSYVKFTTAKYFTAKGRYIHEIGIEPDVEIEFDSDAYYENDVDNQLNKAIEVMQGKLSN